MPQHLERAISASCMVRVRGRDPQRRKSLHHSFYQAVDGYLTLQCSGTLIILKDQGEDGARVHVTCIADILRPFLVSSSPPELLPDTSITCLPSLSSPSPSNSSAGRWWECELIRCDDVKGVQTSVDQLTQSSSEWAVGWSPCTPPCRSHSAATLALLAVQRPLSTRTSSPSSSPSSSSFSSSVSPQGFPPFEGFHFLPASSLVRGLEVSVISSPFGLLSPAVFHSSVSRGIISNIVHPSPSPSLPLSSPSHASFDSAVMRPNDDSSASFHSPSDVSFPRQLHFPLQSSPTVAFVTASHCSSPPPPPSLLLIDARCLAGSEGAPVIFSSSCSSSSPLLAGIVTLPLHQVSGGPVCFNCVITAEALWRWLCTDERSIPHPHFHSFLSSFSSLTSSSLSSPPTLRPASVSSHSSTLLTPALSRAERSLVIARISSSWASAVVLSEDGFVVTNAHLLRPFLSGGQLTSPISLSPSALPSSMNRRWLPASLIHCDEVWDLAILRVDAQSLKGLTVRAPPPAVAEVGDCVFVLGHALFSPSSLLLPTLTRGVLCKIVHSSSSSSEPLLLQTDAAVHNGNSGGLLLSSSGSFLGLVTSNVQHTLRPSPLPSPSSILPHLNFSIPSSVVWAMVRGVRGGLQGVWVKEEVEAVWALNLQEAWEVKVKERSQKFKEVVAMVERMEEEKKGRGEQTVEVQVARAGRSARAKL